MKQVQILFFTSFVLLFTGCSSVPTQDGNGLVAYYDGTESQEDLPLLPRTSAKNAWAGKSKPLPPPPESVLTSNSLMEDRPAPEKQQQVSLKEVAPGEIDEIIRANRGKVLMVNCWGIDCGPCIEELPHLNRISREYASKGLKVVAINTDVSDRHQEVKDFVAKNDFDFDVYLRAPGSDTKFRRSIDPDYAADPYTLIFDKDGNRVASIADALPGEAWENVARAVLSGKPFPITNPDIVRLY